MQQNPAIKPKIPFGIFFGVFVFVFTIVVGTSIITTLLMRNIYMSEARVEVKYKPADGTQTRAQGRTNDVTLAKTQSEIINSEVIMRKVVGDLNLNEAWGKKYLNDGESFKTWDTLKFLKNTTSIRPIPGTALIQIQVYGDSPDDMAIMAIIANSIAKAYTGYTATNNAELQSQIIDSARANKSPIRPNRPLNYVLGILLGIFLGFWAGAGSTLFVYLKRRKAFLGSH